MSFKNVIETIIKSESESDVVSDRGVRLFEQLKELLKTLPPRKQRDYD